MKDLPINQHVSDTLEKLLKMYDPEKSLRDNMVHMLNENGVADAAKDAECILLGITNANEAQLWKKDESELNAEFTENVKKLLKDGEDSEDILLEVLSKLAASDEMAQLQLADKAPVTGEMHKFWNQNYETRKKTFRESFSGLSVDEKVQELSSLLNDSSTAMARDFIGRILKKDSYKIKSKWNNDSVNLEMLQTLGDRMTAKGLFATAQWINRHNGLEHDIPSELDDAYGCGVLSSGIIDIIEAFGEVEDGKYTSLELVIKIAALIILATLILLITALGFLAIAYLPGILGFIALGLWSAWLIYVASHHEEVIEHLNDLSDHFSAWVSRKRNPASRILRELTGATEKKYFKNNVLPKDSDTDSTAEA